MRKLVRKAESEIWRNKPVLGGSIGPLAGSTDDTQPVVPVGLAGSTGGREKDQPERDRVFGRKNSSEIAKSGYQMMELGCENAREGRSTSMAADLWIKTYQNAPKSQIESGTQIWLFLGKFSNLWGKENFEEKSVKPKALIPSNEVPSCLGSPIWPDLTDSPR